jgi:glycosyltransferase involved in cell wall biosynthesis
MRLLFVGRADDPRKNFPLLLDVLRRLEHSGRIATLTVIGPHNPIWKSSLDLVGVGERVSFLGGVSNEHLVDAYLTHDLLLLPSVQEGFGIVVAEAFAAGLPVVATRCGGPEHLIMESGAGFIVDHSASAMAQAIAEFFSSATRAAFMQARALASADSTLSFDRFAASVASVTERLLARSQCSSGV